MVHLFMRLPKTSFDTGNFVQPSLKKRPLEQKFFRAGPQKFTKQIAEKLPQVVLFTLPKIWTAKNWKEGFIRGSSKEFQKLVAIKSRFVILAGHQCLTSGFRKINL